MNITKRSIGFNGLGQFFVHTYYSDGTASSSEPFATGEAAVAEMDRLNLIDAEDSPSEWDEECAMLRWAEMGGYAAGLARPIASHERRGYQADQEWEDIPY